MIVGVVDVVDEVVVVVVGLLVVAVVVGMTLLGTRSMVDIDVPFNSFMIP